MWQYAYVKKSAKSTIWATEAACYYWQVDISQAGEL